MNKGFYMIFQEKFPKPVALPAADHKKMKDVVMAFVVKRQLYGFILYPGYISTGMVSAPVVIGIQVRELQV